MKIVLLLFGLLFFSCTDVPLSEAKLKDLGKIQIGENVYLKMFEVNNSGDFFSDGYFDRVYILVDSTDRLLSNSVSTVQLKGKVRKSIAIVQE